MMAVDSSLCSCGSKKKYRDCCEPYHKGLRKTCHSPLEVLKSRYSAYCDDDGEYVLSSWEEHFRPKVSAKKMIREIKSMKYTGLKIHGVVYTDEAGENAQIYYTVRYRVGTAFGESSSISNFVKKDGVWYYTDDVAKELVPFMTAAFKAESVSEEENKIPVQV